MDVPWRWLVRPDHRLRRQAPRVVIALGGNALLPPQGHPGYHAQLEAVQQACGQVAALVEAGLDVVLTHGNGPQVGNLLLQQEAAAELAPALPLDVCDAETQGQLGYMLAQALRNALHARGVQRGVAAVVTQVIVDAGDPAFAHPTKPIGPFLERAVAQPRMRERGEAWTGVPGRGWRRLVPSPQPRAIVERDVIHALVSRRVVVIACGGGGVPVVAAADGCLEGVEAVIDKDAATARLAIDLHADALLILTDVPGVALDYGLPSQRLLGRIGLAELERLLRDSPFDPGSIGPKLVAARDFLRAGGHQATICALRDALAGLRGEAGTVVTNGGT